LGVKREKISGKAVKIMKGNNTGKKHKTQKKKKKNKKKKDSQKLFFSQEPSWGKGKSDSLKHTQKVQPSQNRAKWGYLENNKLAKIKKNYRGRTNKRRGRKKKIKECGVSSKVGVEKGGTKNGGHLGVQRGAPGLRVMGGPVPPNERLQGGENRQGGEQV